MAAPLPPPASPPIKAPRPAPPPASTAVRFPLPVCVRLTAEVSIVCDLPFTVIEVNFTCNTAPPLNRPSGFASTTVPEASAPAGISVFPSTCTGLESEAVKLCPGWLILDPTACPRRTVNIVPAGTTDGVAGAGFISDLRLVAILEGAELMPPLIPPPELPPAELSALAGAELVV